ncbi:MAG: NAD(P)-binding domain-containing protein [Lawsonibacter sp.]
MFTQNAIAISLRRDMIKGTWSRGAGAKEARLMFQSIGFLGTGQMGGALAQAAVKGAGGAAVLLANRTPAKAQALADQLGCQATDNQTVAARCDLFSWG